MSKESIHLSPREQELKDAVNHIVGGYPEVHIVIDGFNSTLFRVKNKSFVRLAGDEQHGYYLCFKATKETQEFLVQQEPYWKTPYFGQYGWVSTWANQADSWEELGPLLKEAYLLAAPKTLVKQFIS
ncbi:MAG: phosphoribosylglycinamide formyltransferase [Paenibacillus sp.]|nr:phosphoribosylglycinamide formyltransferase [Paenibacillus sp.]